MNMALGAEGDEHRQRTEVVYVVINGADAEGTEVGYDHGAVEGAHIKYGLGYQAEVIAHSDQPDRCADKEAGELCKFVREFLGAVFLVGVFDLVDGSVHLAVNIVDGVGRFKDDLDGGLGGVDAEAALYGHDDFNIITREDPSAHDEAVETGQVGAGAHIGSDQQVKHTHAFVAADALTSEPAVCLRYLKRLLVIIQGVASLGHDEWNEIVKAVQGANASAVNSVSETVFVVISHS